MLERSRVPKLVASATLLLAFVVLAWFAHQQRTPLGPLDDLGRTAEDWGDRNPWLDWPLRIVEWGFGPIGMTVLSAALVVALFVRRQRRAAVYALLVSALTPVLTSVAKAVVGRQRPGWQDPVGLLSSRSFPSGHAASTAAFAGILVVLATVFLRRAGLRRGVGLGAVVLTLSVMADRIMLGRHYPSDTIGGVLLGLAVVLGVLAGYDPHPRPHAENVEPLVALGTSGTKKLAVVLNPIKVESVDGFRQTVEQMAAESGWTSPTWHYTTVEDPGTTMAHDAAVEGADLVLVCGGDGTVREVCAELAGTGIPVGVVPAGTGNLLARNLDIPLYLRAAIDVALNGQDRAIDLVDVSGDGIEDSHFMVMAGMGFDAAIMEGVNEEIKARIGWFAYVLSALKSLMFPVMRVEISIDGAPPTTHRARTVVVGNVGYLQAGMPLLPDAAIDDGQLDVVLLHPRTFLSWLPLAARVLSKSSRTDELIDRMTGRSVVVRASGDVPRQLDGDSIGPGRELRMDCLQGRLLVRVPR